jgi:light-regulated signal transduction histidine kinase (bacteriophytochrome)
MDPAGAGKNGGMITAKNVDLTTCDRELVQYPEAIQPHGVMLTLDDQSNRIVHASANCAELLGSPPEAIAGKPAASVLGAAGRDLVGTLRRLALEAGPMHVARESFVGSDRGFNLFAHRSGGLIILELEKAPPRAAAPSQNLYAELRADIARLQETKSVAEFFDLAVARIRSFTGFDRVMAYRFDEDGSGHVIAEDKRDDLEPYLGLHYPATDIPAPARRMFSLAWVRHLPDVDYVPVPLVPASGSAIAGPVDMSFASLRSVSVMYSGYLKNMGVKATLVMPLMKEGKLWGLISAMHHSGPRHVPHETRMAAEFLAHSLSLLMSAKEDAEVFARVLAMNATTDEIAQALTADPDFGKTLGSPENLALVLGQVDAAGAAVVSQSGVSLIGKTPSADEVRALAGWLSSHGHQVFHTDRLPLLYEPAKAFAQTGSGVMAILMGPRRPEMLLWFRPEQIEVVSWAGDPHKPVDVSETGAGGVRLMPRGSFALWKESVRSRSTAWRDNEKAAAHKLRLAICDLVAGRAEKVERISRALEETQAEADSFSHAASHDLKDHLHGIHHLATLLHRKQGDRLDEEGRQQIATILKLTQRMDTLVDALLEHSHAGKTDLAVENVDLDGVVDAALLSLRPQLAAAGAEVRRPARLGAALCNRELVQEVFANLIGNAVKYNDKPARWVEIGAEHAHPVRYYVRDNGIGIPEADQHTIFKIFRRLHEREDYGGGAGIGLAFTRKIVERHGGRIWVKSAPGEGATFTFTLAPDEAG